MDDGKKQIIQYFIEEAQEHLETVEQGLLDLSEVIRDAERVNEMFRAAHSVKGGAAMLGFESIQKTAHKMEDCFKILRDHPLPVDQQMETMFLNGYDTLKALVEELANSSNFTLRPEVVSQVLSGSEANFEALQNYLNELLSTSTQTISVPNLPAKTAIAATAVVAPPNITVQITELLKQMLQLFKQGESATTRQNLGMTCQQLAKLGQGTPNWQNLLRTVATAIVNPKNNYATLAPVIIKELKQAGDLLSSNRASEIMPSPALQQLAAPTAPATPTVNTTTVNTIAIPVDPKVAASKILQSFSKQQVTELVVLLHRAVTTAK